METDFLLSYIQNVFDVFSQGSFAVFAGVMALGGWLVIVWLLFFAGLHLYGEMLEDRYKKDWEWVLLAIDVPIENVQTPKAVEQTFNHLAGALENASFPEQYIYGHKQRWFSFEIISIEGYIQFLIRTERKFYDLVVASIYAQYPNAEVIEVEDYVNNVPEKYPNEFYNIWGADFGLAEHEAFPLRMYEQFKNSIGKDIVLSDPMGTFLESFSRIGAGEQLWFQMLIQPTGGHWKEGAIEKIKELIGEKVVRKKGPFSFLTDNFITKELQHSLNELNAQLTGTARPELEDAHGSESEGGNSLSSLTPGQKGLVEAMELKISKIGFKTKLRALYLAQKENFHPERAVNALVGAMSQYNIPTSNSLIPKKDTSDNNPKKAEKKKTEMLKLYKKRKISSGANAFVLNIEELATIWHFPMSHVMTPRVQMAAIKQAEPPSGLPIEVLSNSISDLPESPPKSASSTDMDAFHFPPYMTDSGDTAHHHDSDFG